jgi:hypothetical protein
MQGAIDPLLVRNSSRELERLLEEGSSLVELAALGGGVPETYECFGRSGIVPELAKEPEALLGERESLREVPE